MLGVITVGLHPVLCVIGCEGPVGKGEASFHSKGSYGVRSWKRLSVCESREWGCHSKRNTAVVHVQASV